MGPPRPPAAPAGRWGEGKGDGACRWHSRTGDSDRLFRPVTWQQMGSCHATGPALGPQLQCGPRPTNALTPASLHSQPGGRGRVPPPPRPMYKRGLRLRGVRGHTALSGRTEPHSALPGTEVGSLTPHPDPHPPWDGRVTRGAAQAPRQKVPGASLVKAQGAGAPGSALTDLALPPARSLPPALQQGTGLGSLPVDSS